MSCRTVSDFLDRHANDVSRGGIFVRNAQVLAVGCTVRLNLQLADGSTLLAGEGTVFWTREADPTRAESEPGMGIRFTRLTNESQRMLTHLLAEKTERERHEDRPEFDEMTSARSSRRRRRWRRRRARATHRRRPTRRCRRWPAFR